MSILRFGRAIPTSLREWERVFERLNLVIQEDAGGTTITADVLNAGNVSPNDAAFVTLAANDSLSMERVLTPASGELTLTDNGAGNTVELGLDDVGTPGSYAKVTVDAKGRVTAGGALGDADIPATIARDSEVTSAIATHEAAGDPHPVYMTQAEVEALMATQYALRYDQDADPPTLAYLGEADPGTATSSAAWRIKKLTFGGDGDVTTEWADGDSSFNNVWDNRASLSYS